MTRALILGLLAVCLAPFPALAAKKGGMKTATVTVIVENIAAASGSVDVAMCREGEFLGEDCRYIKTTPAIPGTVKVTFKKVQPGDYAVQVHHDENGNGKMDWDWAGIFPAEAYGFSRLGKIYAEPDFADAAFAVTSPQTSVSVKLTQP